MVYKFLPKNTSIINGTPLTKTMFGIVQRKAANAKFKVELMDPGVLRKTEVLMGEQQASKQSPNKLTIPLPGFKDRLPKPTLTVHEIGNTMGKSNIYEEWRRLRNKM